MRRALFYGAPGHPLFAWGKAMVFVSVFAALLLLLLAAAYITYRIAFHSPDKTQNDIHNIPKDEQYVPHKDVMLRMIDTLNERPCERVRILSDDGLRLCGRYYHVKDGAPLDIGFHGYRGSAIRDFCGGVNISFETGHNVLLVDQRAQGESEGHTMTFGIKERYDCLRWIAYANKRFGDDTEITLYGVSMGAATVLMASGLDLPGNVRRVIADSPYSSPKKIIKTVCGYLKLPPDLVYPVIALGALLFGHFRLSAETAANAVRHAKIPILIIHGEDDRFVPCEMSAEIAEANPRTVRRETFPQAGHGISYMQDKDRYERLIREFMKD